eukprot:TRINITY_DN1551_c0_g2_i1.p1 TRINITY_DN1551_c0_g2~~TRINITY_DN1551_c0_g2_i1.p1  ORF type:complete len:977 (-),score=232.10 TRINITY_DN1551_c0_g2_i1:17-2881(-)
MAEPTDEQKVANIASLIKVWNKRILDNQTAARNQQESEAILIMGKTGAGKSTLACLLSGKALKSGEDEDAGEFYYALKNPAETDIKIAAAESVDSETTIPNKIYNQDGTRLIWDCPGFADTKGVEQEILNAFYIYQIVRTIPNLKFVLTVKFSDLTDKEKIHFRETLQNFCQMFHNIEDLQNSVCLVVTHAPQNKKASNMKVLLERTKNTKISEQNSKVIDFLTEDRIFLFHQPKENGEELVDLEFLPNIDKSVEFKDVREASNVAISEKSMPLANQLFDVSNKVLTERLTLLAEKLKQKCEEINNPANEIQAAPQPAAAPAPAPDAAPAPAPDAAPAAEGWTKRLMTRVQTTFFSGYVPSHIKKTVPPEERSTPASPPQILEVAKLQQPRYKQLLALSDICLFRSACSGILKPDGNVTADTITAEVNRIILGLKNSADPAELTSLQTLSEEVHDRITAVRFFEQICTEKTIDVSAWSAVFKQAQEELEKAAKKGVADMTVSEDETSYDYYDHIRDYLDTCADKASKEFKLKQSTTLFHMGRIACGAEDFEEGIRLYGDVLQIEGLAAGEGKATNVYENVVNLFLNHQDKIDKIKDLITKHATKKDEDKKKLYEVSNKNFLAELAKLETAIKALLVWKDDFYKKSKRHHVVLKYLDTLDRVNSGIQTLRESKAFEKEVVKVLKVLRTDAKERPSGNGKAIANLSKSLLLHFRSVAFFGGLAATDPVCAEAWKLLETSQTEIKDTMVKKLETVTLENDGDKELAYFQRVAGYLGRLPKMNATLKTRAHAYLLMGKLYQRKKKLDAALKCLNKAILLDNGLNDARKIVAEIQKEKKDFQGAHDMFKTIKEYEAAIMCLAQVQKGSAVDVAVQKAHYYFEIGRFEEAVMVLQRAFRHTLSEDERRRLMAEIAIALNADNRKKVFDDFTAMAAGSKDMLPKTVLLTEESRELLSKPVD